MNDKTKQLIQDIINVANDVIRADIHMVIGCRQLIGLTRDLNFGDIPDIGIFEVVESEADPYPIGDRLRSMWNKDALKKKDAEYEVAVGSYFPDVKEACLELIEKSNQWLEAIVTTPVD